MTFWKLIRRSLRFHARSHLGVVLGAAIGSAVLIGALVVGDSVKESLRRRSAARLGNIQYALTSSDRLFRAGLADDLTAYWKQHFVKGGAFVPALKLPATIERTDGLARASHIQVVGVDESFSLVARDDRFRQLKGDALFLNQALANHLAVGKGDSVLLRVRKPKAVFGDNALSPRSDDSVVLRMKINDVLSADALGDFNLSVSSSTVFNVFLPLDKLQEEAAAQGKANALFMENALWEQTIRVVSDSGLEFRLRNLYSKIFRKNSGLNYHWTNSQGDGIWYVETKPSIVSFTDGPHWIWPDRSVLNVILNVYWRPEDAGLVFKVLPNLNEVELRTSSVFLESSIERSVYEFPHPSIAKLPLRGNERKNWFVVAGQNLLTNWNSVVSSNAQPILTYLGNQFRSSTNTTPYSMITAAGAPWTPAEMRDDEIILNQWLADDLQAKPGDEISLTYFDPESGARLVERTNTFRVRGIVPMEMPWADRTLMPDFPGIEKAESTSDWDAGFPLVHKIRPKDEDYWKKYRGTPKAFVTLAAGKKMWANRFGELTAIRFPIPGSVSRLQAAGEGEMTNATPSASPAEPDHLKAGHQTVEGFRVALEKKILASLKPEELGLRFEPVREQALKAAEQSQDFGQLFLGFSFFIIVAALVLMALLFQFGLEQRTTEIGTLLALGFTQKQVRRLLLREGIVLALIGGAIGALGGIFYAKAMLHGLTTVWRDAIGTSSLQFHASPKTLAIGFLASTVVATVTIWLTLRKQAKRPARELLAEGGDCRLPIADRQWCGRNFTGILAIASSFVAAGLIGWAISRGETTNVEIFFSAGALVLVAGLAFSAAWLQQLSEGGVLRRPNIKSEKSQGVVKLRPPMTGFVLAVRSCARRRKRSVATVAMLACGSFLIVAISAFRLDSNQNATKRSSGTGGFALVGETTMPVVHDLNSKSGKEFFALNENDLDGVSFVPFRVREGDEASCLNLNRAQKPRLLGVKPEMLTERLAFSFAKLMEGADTKTHPWSILSKTSVPDRAPVERDEIPAIGDANSIQWALHKKIGDTIDYTDERGNVFKLRLVGAVANSILQGSLIIDEAEFVKRFPSESGYKMFLIDAPTNRVADVSAALSRAMEDVGLELTPAARRLNEFNAVQNTYLGTFQILGGLGLLLGSAGLGIVVLRNVLERRGELGLLVAVGFRKRALQWMLLSEHGALLGVGLGIGVLAAVVAILPSLISPSAEIPFASVGITLGAVLLNGSLWTWVATRVAVRGNLLAALRNE